MKIVYLLIFLVTFTSCGNDTFKSKEELLAFINNEDNGFLQKKNINGIEISLLYRPTDLLVIQEMKKPFNNAARDSLRNKYSSNIYFNLSFSFQGEEILNTIPTDRNSYGELVNTLAFGIKEKVHLVTSSQDTIEIADYIFPRLYGMSNTNSLMIVYTNKKEILSEKTLNLIIEDFGANTGEIKFKIPTAKLSNQPSLSFN
jgi:hypothetical protein